LPHGISLEIISHVGLPTIYDALRHWEQLRLVALLRSDQKCIFTDHGKHVTYACVGP
jgi:Fe2+ or Zn2+ uptake regulation protein